MVSLKGFINLNAGVRADLATRKARISAHNEFDKMWKGDAPFSRTVAYQWLAAKLGINQTKCHMQKMDVSMCSKVVMVCREYNETIGKAYNEVRREMVSNRMC